MWNTTVLTAFKSVGCVADVDTSDGGEAAACYTSHDGERYVYPTGRPCVATDVRPHSSGNLLGLVESRRPRTRHSQIRGKSTLN